MTNQPSLEQVFNDFGDAFKCYDTNGEQPISAMVSAIDADGVVACQDETRHGFEEGDHVTFSEVSDLLTSLFTF